MSFSWRQLVGWDSLENVISYRQPRSLESGKMEVKPFRIEASKSDIACCGLKLG